jgi:hypothetical protein
MKRLVVPFTILVAVVGVLSCKAKQDEDSGYIALSCEYEPSYAADIVTEQRQSKPILASESDYSDLSSTRMIIRTASLSIKVEDVNTAYTRSAELADAYGGYVASGRISEGESSSASLTLKVNPRGFTPLIKALEQLGSVDQKVLSGEDVTEEYIDLEAELETKLQLRARLYRFLDKVKTVEEMLQVESELERVDYDVNRIKGRLKYLENMIAESTISLKLYKEQPPEPEPFIDWNDVGKGFINLARKLVGVFISLGYGLVFIIPFGLAIVIIVWIVVHVVRKRKKKKTKVSK